MTQKKFEILIEIEAKFYPTLGDSHNEKVWKKWW
jgi:hypothetical protein